MRAIILEEIGLTPKLATFQKPSLEEGEVMVRVAATSIKQLDRAIAMGTHYSSPKKLPIVCGTDGVGILEDGTPLYFFATRSPYGTMAEYCPSKWYLPLKKESDLLQVAAAMNPAIGAWLPLEWRAKMVKGERVLIMGATGATGRLAVKIAKILGAKSVIAVGRMSSGLANVGADHIIDSELSDDLLKSAFKNVIEEGVDIIIDYLWGRPAEILIPLLASNTLSVSSAGEERGIRYVTVGEMAGANISLPSGVFRSSHLKLLGSGTGNFPSPPILKEYVTKIIGEIEKRTLAVEIEVRKFSEVGKVWNQNSGTRVVLEP